MAHQFTREESLRGSRNAVAKLEAKVRQPGGARYRGLLAGARKRLAKLERVQ